MDRRTFCQTAVAAPLAFSRVCADELDKKTHFVTLSFDDGFKKSCFKIADIYEEFGLHACFNIIASGHLPDFKRVDQWIRPELMGDFEDWNKLKQRGHEVMPHGWIHKRLTKLPLNEAKDLITKCLDYFEENLDGYKSSEAVFNFPYLSSNRPLEEFALKRVSAVRTWGKSMVNPLPAAKTTRVTCGAKGPKDCSEWVEQQINKFLAVDEGWLILCLHGLDDEGWGPIPAQYLRERLARLTKMPHVDVVPTGELLKRAL